MLLPGLSGFARVYIGILANIEQPAAAICSQKSVNKRKQPFLMSPVL